MNKEFTKDWQSRVVKILSSFSREIERETFCGKQQASVCSMLNLSDISHEEQSEHLPTVFILAEKFMLKRITPDLTI